MQRGKFESIRIGSSWTPTSVNAHIPSIDITSAMRYLERARNTEGDIEKAKWDGIKRIYDASVGILDKMIGVRKKLNEKYESSMVKEEIYKEMCIKDPRQYNPETARLYAQNTENAKARRDGLGIFATEASKITEAENREGWLTELRDTVAKNTVDLTSDGPDGMDVTLPEVNKSGEKAQKLIDTITMYDTEEN